MLRSHELIGSPADSAPTLPDLLWKALHDLLAQQRPENELKGDLRPALQEACDRARNDGLRVEELLLVLKDAWREQLERRGLPRIDTDAVLARIVTACIDEYYHSPPPERDLGEGRVFYSQVSMRDDAQRAEMP